MTTPEPAVLYVPVNLDLSPLPSVHRDYARDVLNLIQWRGACCRRADDDGFVDLKWQYLTRFIPRGVWLAIRDWLTDTARQNGPVLLCDSHAVPGAKSYGYMLAGPYRGVRRVECQDE